MRTDWKSIFEAVVMVSFISIMAFYNFTPTGQQVAGSVATTTTLPGATTTTTTWPGNCARPCQLDTSVGMLDIGSNCISIKQYYEEKMCCIKEDCGGGVCASGRCR